MLSIIKHSNRINQYVTMMRVGSKWSNDLVEAGLILTPVVGVALIFIWYSIHTIAQGTTVNASIANPIGFIIANFVYDGLVNIENIVLSCAFLFVLFLFCPTFLRIRTALLFPAIAVASGVIAMLAATFTCGTACSFYGMSGVAGGVVGFTFANFCVVIGLAFFRTNARSAHIRRYSDAEDKLPRYSVFVLLVSYIILLLVISGFFAIHPTSTSNPFPIIVQIPISIASESQSVQVGHSTGISFGFSLSLVILLSLLKRRPHLQKI